MRRSVTCSKCGREGHNKVSCGSVPKGPNVSRAKANVGKLNVTRYGNVGEAQPSPVGDVESVAQRLRITTPAYPSEHISNVGPSEGYSSLRSGKSSRERRDPKLVRFLQSSMRKVRTPERVNVVASSATYTDPAMYWQEQGARGPSEGYSPLSQKRKNLM